MSAEVAVCDFQDALEELTELEGPSSLPFSPGIQKSRCHSCLLLHSHPAVSLYSILVPACQATGAANDDKINLRKKNFFKYPGDEMLKPLLVANTHMI